MNSEVKGGLAWAGGMITLALAATLARKLGYLDRETVTRLVIGANGLMIAWYGNRMPKNFLPSACARQYARLGGWSMFLGGLVYAGLFAFAPIPIAVVLSCGTLILGQAIAISYCLAQRASAKTL